MHILKKKTVMLRLLDQSNLKIKSLNSITCVNQDMGKVDNRKADSAKLWYSGTRMSSEQTRFNSETLRKKRPK